ncbi:MAG: hypothetical protein EAX90_12675 [Candidatus Heimdallarchaeota archaeon]|nr:hypothetical protein [Candidatus Heimdallarchaeota archaeon]
MNIRTRKKTIIQLLVLLIILTPIYGIKSKTDNLDPFFSIAILAPSTSSSYSPWPTILREQLPKIGINVSVFDHTGWAQISPRTWGYSGPFPIPSYDEGGYDILFLGWGFDIDYNPLGILDSDAITPNGDNFYQYNSPEMDDAIYNFSKAYVLEDRLKWAEKIQTIFYEDQPNIALMYPKTMYIHDEDLMGWNSVLWHLAQEPIINWQIPGKTEFHYAVPDILNEFHPITCDEDHYDRKWLHQIYNGLVERDSSIRNTYGPWLAENFSSSDGLVYTVTIKNNASWADGTPITTDDIIYNYQLAYLLDSLEHYNYNINWNYDAITKINDKQFTIEFIEPSFLQNNNLGVDLVPKHIWESIPPINHTSQARIWVETQPEKLFGAGPYKLVLCDFINNVIQLTRNPYFDDWYGSKPYFEDLFFKEYSYIDSALEALEEGTIDMVDEGYYLSYYYDFNIPEVRETVVDEEGVHEIAINQEHPYLGTGELCPIAGKESAKHIRKAISHIIPRQSVIYDIYDGFGTPGVTQFPIVGIGFSRDLDFYDYDLNLAKYHMALAGFDISYSSIDPNAVKTLLVGIGFPTILNIIALIGGCYFIKKTKTI